MAFEGMCPYLKSSEGSGMAVCECAKFQFPDKHVKRDVLYGLCGHPTEWMSCRFKKALDRFYYERKFQGEKINKRDNTSAPL